MRRVSFICMLAASATLATGAAAQSVTGALSGVSSLVPLTPTVSGGTVVGALAAASSGSTSTTTTSTTSGP